MADAKNRLFWGDNLEVMRKHLKEETVDLCYIDPPFNSKRRYFQIYNNIGSDDLAQAQAFIDSWRWDDEARAGFAEIASNEGARFTVQTIELITGLRNVLKEGPLLAYLVSMTRRIVEIRRALKSSGSFYLHCDPTASHYLKLVCDGIFCSQGGDFVNELVWQRTSAHNDPARFGRVHDVLFYYTKGKGPTWNQQYDPPDADYFAAHDFERDERGRLYRKRDLTAPAHASTSGQYEWRGRKPSSGRMWSYTEENMRRLEKEGRIVYTRTGMPRLKIYAEDLKGVPLQDVWVRPDLWLNSASAERLGYPTQKPVALLERIILTSTNEGDVVFDPFCGCGTTISAAQKHRRQWVGIDITYQSIALVLRRLEDQFGPDVTSAIALDGVPRDLQSAHALANKKDDRLRKEFEKWAILTYTRNRAAINQKKGADAGIDGYAYIFTNRTDVERIVFQVKSGSVGRGDVAKLKGDMERERAVIGTLITLEEPTQPMRTEAKKAGLYTHPFTGATYDRVQIMTIREILEERRRLDMPLNAEVLKAAVSADYAGEQGEFNLEPVPVKKSKMAKASLPLGFNQSQPSQRKRR